MSTLQAMWRVGAVMLVASGCAPDIEGAGTELGVSIQTVIASAGYGTVSWEELNPLPAGGSLAELGTAANLDVLQQHGLALVLHWRSDDLEDRERWALVDEAIARDIPIIPWLTLPEGSADDHVPGSAHYAQTGYFPNATNYAAWISASRSLMSLWRSRGLPPTTMVVDLEMRKERLQEFDRLTRAGDLGALVRFLRAGFDRPRYARALAAFKEYVDLAHGLGFKVALSTLLPMLDDYSDGDDSLRQAFGVPIENNPRAPGATAWDTISFQAHRTIYQQTFPNLTPFFVYDYGRVARSRFGARAGLDLGLTHGGVSSATPVYADGEQLRLDVEAALAAGISGARLGVYSFLGIYGRAPVEQWLQPPRAKPASWPAFDLGTPAAHASTIALDALL